ncbi:MAG: LPS-assembly protein LptD [Opitutales bacterium]
MLHNARLFLYIPLAVLALPVSAALPELSSIEPLEYDEDAKRVVARGDAQLKFNDTRVRADRITFYEEYGLADAEGEVAVDREGSRLIAERLNYDTQTRTFAADGIRTGTWPFYLSGETGGGSREKIQVQEPRLYYGPPDSLLVPNIKAETVTYAEGDPASVDLENATLRVGDFPFFYLPGYTHNLDQSFYLVNIDAGQDSTLGAHLQTTWLFPMTSWLRVGGNVDIYSKRGALAGPAAQYTHASANQWIKGALTTGYIQDEGDTEEDIFDRPIDEDRGFVEWRHKQHIGERVTLTGSASYWSDSEVTRDFRDAIFDENRQPDNYFESIYTGDNYFMSAFGRFQPNDFQLVQERLPEVRFDMLPTPVFETGAYHRFSASYARLREDFGRHVPTFREDTEADRMDLNYRIERPIHFSDWLTFTPLAGARLTHYANQSVDPGFIDLRDDSFTRDMFEIGFDLEGRAYATYPTVNRTWEIDGLRHIVKPSLRYRYFSDPDAKDEIAAIERDAFDLQRPVLDLGQRRNVDALREAHLARLGVENLFQTRADGYGSRTLAALNFYQDILFEKNERFDRGKQDTFNATWAELLLNPAPWLKFNLSARFKTESMTLEELRTRTALKSGDIWELGLSTELLNKRIDQYRLDFIHRVNERYALLSDLRFDADSGDFTQAGIGVRTRISSVWELVYALTFREGARRESDVEFSIHLRLMEL